MIIKKIDDRIEEYKKRLILLLENYGNNILSDELEVKIEELEWVKELLPKRTCENCDQIWTDGLCNYWNTYVKLSQYCSEWQEKE